MVEDEIPYDKFAINGKVRIRLFTAPLIRSSETTAAVIARLDDMDRVQEVLYVKGNYQPDYSYTLTSLGLQEGDRVALRYYGISEYDAMNYYYEKYGTLNSTSWPAFNDSDVKRIIESGVLSDGAYFGYNFTVDNTAPVLLRAVTGKNTMTIYASDNQNVAYIGLFGTGENESVKYGEMVPEYDETAMEFHAEISIPADITEVKVKIGDYAGNETISTVYVERPVLISTRLDRVKKTNTSNPLINKKERQTDLTLIFDGLGNAVTVNPFNNGDDFVEPVVPTIITPPRGKVYDVDIDISYSEVLTNGFVIISYDPMVAEYDGISGNLIYRSVSVDDENGIIKIAFADCIEFSYSSIIASVHFKARQCISSEITVTTEEKNNAFELNDVETAAVDGHHHWTYYGIKWQNLNSNPEAYILYRCDECGTFSGYIKLTITKTVGAVWTEYKASITARKSLDGKSHESRRKVLNKYNSDTWTQFGEREEFDVELIRP